MRRLILTCGVGVLALAACAKKTDQAASGSEPAAAAATQPAATPAAPPIRKAGLWEQTIASDRMHQTIRMCVDEAVEQKARWWRSEGGGRGKSDCSDQRVTPRAAGGWEIHAVCQAPDGTKTVTDGVAGGDFGASYHVDLTSVTSGSPMPQANGTRKMHMDGAWKGPCPADMKPGDMQLPGGMRISTTGAPPAASGAGDGAPAYGPNHPPSPADIAKMRAQAMAMARQMQADGAK
jgi:hypothetical protein